MAPVSSPSYYDVLGVPRGASTQDIQAAFRQLAKQLHPDVNPDPAATERFKRVAEAHAVLADPAQKATYDWTLETGMADRLRAEGDLREREAIRGRWFVHTQPSTFWTGGTAWRGAIAAIPALFFMVLIAASPPSTSTTCDSKGIVDTVNTTTTALDAGISAKSPDSVGQAARTAESTISFAGCSTSLTSAGTHYLAALHRIDSSASQAVSFQSRTDYAGVNSFNSAITDLTSAMQDYNSAVDELKAASP